MTFVSALSCNAQIGADQARDIAARFFADNNLDVKDAYGYDINGLFYHFCMCGMNEHRQANSEFNPVKYRQLNPDVEAVYGDKWTGYYAHYCFGKLQAFLLLFA